MFPYRLLSVFSTSISRPYNDSIHDDCFCLTPLNLNETLLEKEERTRNLRGGWTGGPFMSLSGASRRGDKNIVIQPLYSFLKQLS
jgi:hypothetical protein